MTDMLLAIGLPIVALVLTLWSTRFSNPIMWLGLPVIAIMLALWSIEFWQ